MWLASRVFELRLLVILVVGVTTTERMDVTSEEESKGVSWKRE